MYLRRSCILAAKGWHICRDSSVSKKAWKDLCTDAVCICVYGRTHTSRCLKTLEWKMVEGGDRDRKYLNFNRATPRSTMRACFFFFFFFLFALLDDWLILVYVHVLSSTFFIRFKLPFLFPSFDPRAIL